MTRKRKSTRRGKKRKKKAPSPFARAPRPPPLTSPFARARVVRAPMRKMMGGGPFARVTPPPSTFPEGATPGWREWTLDRGGSPLGPVPFVRAEYLDDMASESVYAELNRLDVDPYVAAQLASIDPRGTYVVVAKVRGGSGRAGKEDRKGASDQNTVVLVGRGARLWTRFMALADPEGGGSELLDVEVIEAAEPGAAGAVFPLWSNETIETGDGRTIRGSGRRALYEQHRAREALKKNGRAKKSGGGMTSSERRKDKGARKSQKRRKDRIDARVRALEASGDSVAARRLQKRSKKARESAGRKRKPGKGRTR